MKLTVILPCYNVDSCVARAVLSVQAQGMTDWELLAVDDGSTDQTLPVLQAFADADPRVRILRSETNHGPGAARNRAIEAATGEWIGLIDADDAWAPTRAERMIDVAEKAGVDLAADNLLLFDHHAGATTGPLLPPGFGTQPLCARDVLAAEARIAGPRWGLLKPFVRRTALQRTGVRYAEDLRLSEDLLFLCDLLLSGAEGILIDDPLYIYTAQRGAHSGARSPHSRSPRDPADRLTGARRLLARHRASASPPDAAALDRFASAMGAVVDGARITGLRREGRSLAALAFALLRPQSAWRYIATSPSWRRWVGRDD